MSPKLGPPVRFSRVSESYVRGSPNKAAKFEKNIEKGLQTGKEMRVNNRTLEVYVGTKKLSHKTRTRGIRRSRSLHRNRGLSRSVSRSRSRNRNRTRQRQ